MTGDRHVRSCERRGVRLPPPTHPVCRWSIVIAMPAQKRLICVCDECRAEVPMA